MRKNLRIYDAERHAVLAAVYAKEGTEMNQDKVGAYRTKIIKAGDMLYISCYPLITSREVMREQDARLAELEAGNLARKQRVAWAKYNNARRVRDFEILCQANFYKDDLHVCCTYSREMDAWYDHGERPSEYIHGQRQEKDFINEDDARRHIRNYIARVKRLLKRRGCDASEFRWLLVTVRKEAQQESSVVQPDRFHHHMLMHGVPEDLRNEIERLWPFGTCDTDRLQPDGKGIADMAGYIARQEGKANGDAYKKHSFSTSRNIIKPQPKTSDVKISRRRVSQIAADVRANGMEIFGKLYPEYRLTEPPQVKISDFTAGAYIYARLKRIEQRKDTRRIARA